MSCPRAGPILIQCTDLEVGPGVFFGSLDNRCVLRIVCWRLEPVFARGLSQSSIEPGSLKGPSVLGLTVCRGLAQRYDPVFLSAASGMWDRQCFLEN